MTADVHEIKELREALSTNADYLEIRKAILDLYPDFTMSVEHAISFLGGDLYLNPAVADRDNDLPTFMCNFLKSANKSMSLEDQVKNTNFFMLMLFTFCYMIDQTIDKDKLTYSGNTITSPYSFYTRFGVNCESIALEAQLKYKEKYAFLLSLQKRSGWDRALDIDIDTVTLTLCSFDNTAIIGKSYNFRDITAQELERLTNSLLNGWPLSTFEA